MRDVTARLRAALANLRSHGHDESNDECGTPWMLQIDRPSIATEEPLIPARPRSPAPPLNVSVPPVPRPVAPGDTGAAGLVAALSRVADTFEKLAAGLEADRRERGARLDAVEALVRELVSGLSQGTAVAPIVVGGTIDLSDSASESEPTLLPGRAGVDRGVDPA
jgi:hypothetical protein